MDTLVLPKPAYNVLRRFTGETHPDLALSDALKDLVHLRLEATQTVIAVYEEKYGIPFIKFKEAWEAGRISARHPYEIERDYWAWEAADSDVKALRELANRFQQLVTANPDSFLRKGERVV